MKGAAILPLLGAAGVQAFIAPAPARAPRAAPRMATELVGYDVETGGKPWDPLGLGKISERNKLSLNPHVKWLAEAEIKHGRIAMLAFLGVLAPALGFHVPTYPIEPDWTQAWGKALYSNPLGISQILLAVGLIEGQTERFDLWKGEGTKEIGNLGFDPLNLGKDPAKRKRYALSEVKNGRLAMIAMASFASEHFVPGSVPLLKNAFPFIAHF